MNIKGALFFLIIVLIQYLDHGPDGGKTSKEDY